MPGPCRAFEVWFTALLACGCGTAFAADTPKRPLQLKLASAPAPALALASPTAPRQPAGSRRAEHFRLAEPSLGERALTSLLDDADAQAQRSPGPADGASFQFKRRGNAGRDLARGYNDMCDAVSRKLWDDPKGKRVKFDVAGKPGVGIEIPLR